MQIPINKIEVGTRYRKDFGDIEHLALSIQRYGQLQPIIVSTNGDSYLLIAGERRLRACVSLGRDTIEAIDREELDEITRREIELEENIARKEFTWPEEVLALAELYQMKQERYGKRTQRSADNAGYGLEDASEELDRSIGGISMDLQLANGLHKFPELVKEKSKTAAFRRFRLLRETALRRELASRTRDEPEEEENENEPARQQLTPDQSSIRKTGFKGYGLLYLGDAYTVLSSYPAESVDCIVTDPPFAINLFKSGDRLSSTAGEAYDDDPQVVLDKIDLVVRECARILKQSGHLYMFFHHNVYEDVMTILERHFGDAVTRTPLIWIKNKSGIGDPHRNWVYAYEPCAFVNRGRMLITPQQYNYIKCDTVAGVKRIHPTEKPPALLRQLIGASCLAGEVVLDPFAGSGSTLTAAVQHGCKFIGVELNEKFYRATVERLSEVIGKDQEAHEAEATTHE